MPDGGFSCSLVTHGLLPLTNFEKVSQWKFIKNDEYEDEARRMTLFRRIFAKERVDNLKENIPDSVFI